MTCTSFSRFIFLCKWQREGAGNLSSYNLICSRIFLLAINWQRTRPITFYRLSFYAIFLFFFESSSSVICYPFLNFKDKNTTERKSPSEPFIMKCLFPEITVCCLNKNIILIKWLASGVELLINLFIRC